MQQLRPQLLTIPGLRVFVGLPPSLRIGGRMGNQNFSIMMQAMNTDELYAGRRSWSRRSHRMPGLQDVTSDLEIKSPRINMVIDRDQAAAVGLNATTIQNALYDAFGPQWSLHHLRRTRQYRVLSSCSPNTRAPPTRLQKLYFKTPSGALVPLESVVEFQGNGRPAGINHSGQLPSVTISFALKPGRVAGQATSTSSAVAGSRAAGHDHHQLPGNGQGLSGLAAQPGLLLFVAIGVVYIVLGVLYESYIHPLTILSGLASAGFGALLTLLSFKSRSQHLLVRRPDHADRHRQEERDHADRFRAGGRAQARQVAAPKPSIEGCLIRFRPIMMTTMAALLGALPIALGYGAGGEARRPLGLAVVGGLSSRS